MLARFLTIVLFAFATLCAGNEISNFTPSNLTYGDLFGFFVAADGDLIVSSALGTNNFQGSAYVFNCTNAANCNVTQLLNITTGYPDDIFGYSIGISGDLVAIGAPGANNSQGAVYIYNCSSGTNCTLASNITLPNPIDDDFFGAFVFVQNSSLVVGAPGRNLTGEAYVFNCTNAANCTLASNLTSANASRGDQFGISVGIHDWLVVVGADFTNNTEGAAYMFNCSNIYNCTEMAILTPPNGTFNEEFFFGQLLYVSNNNLTYISAIGANHGQGAVYVYNCSSGTNCTLLSTLTGLNQEEEFGSFVVAVNNTVVIGAQLGDNQMGSAYVFNCTNASNCTQLAILNANSSASGDLFGFSAAISQNTIIIGAPFANDATGEIYTYSLTSLPSFLTIPSSSNSTTNSTSNSTATQ